MNKTYAFSDIHGCYDVLKQILKYCDDTDIIYFLGDACDRGPEGLKCIQTLKDESRVIYLKGNHEDIAAKALPAIFDETLWDTRDTDVSIWYSNGGVPTIDDFSKCSLESIYSYVRYFNSLQLNTYYINKNGQLIILDHAGFTPFISRKHDPLWDREHFKDKWIKDDNIFLIHGHTPVQYLKFYYGYEGQEPETQEEMEWKREFMENENTGWRPSVIRYCSGHKFDIDLGTCFSGVAALLDLDTLEPIYFDKDGAINDGR